MRASVIHKRICLVSILALTVTILLASQPVLAKYGGDTPKATPTPPPTPTSTPTNTPIARKIYVDWQNMGPTWDGTKENPFQKIMDAVNYADNDDIIYVAEGIYHEPEQTNQVTMKNYTYMYGGYQHITWKRDPTSFQTVIDGGGSGSGFACYNINNGRIDGFVIQNCYHGIQCNISTLTITNNIIQNCHAPSTDFGGGINLTASSPRIFNNLIIYCSAGKDGGGIEVHSNSTPEIWSNTIAYCQVGRNGAGIMIDNSSRPHILHNIIAFNTLATAANGDGGGIYLKSDSTAIIEYNNLWQNTTENYIGLEDPTGENGNISCNPRFFTGGGGDFYLEQVASGQTNDSCCLDAGGHNASIEGLDIYTTRTDGVSDIGTLDLGFHYWDAVPPCKPGNLFANAGDRAVTFWWDHCTQEDLLGYYIYKSSDYGASYERWNPQDIPYPGSAIQVKLFRNDVEYYFYVTSLDRAKNEGVPSNNANARPLEDAPGPVGYLVTYGGNGYVDLSWGEAENASRYNVYRALCVATETPVAYHKINQAFLTETTYRDETVQNNQCYVYRTSGQNVHYHEGWWSPASEAVPKPPTSTPTASPTASPTVDTATPTPTRTWTPSPSPTGPPFPPEISPEPPYSAGTENEICWSDESRSGAIAYYAEASTSPSFTFAASSGWITALCHTFTNLTHATTYYYRVKAKGNPDKESDWSRTVSSTQDAIPPKIYAGGFWDTIICQNDFAIWLMMAYLPGQDDITKVSLLYDNSELGLELNDNGINGDWVAGDDLYSLALNILPGVPVGEYPFQMRAYDKASNIDTWPYLSVFAKSPVTSSKGLSKIDNLEVFHQFSYALDAYLEDLESHDAKQKGANRPMIYLAGYWDTDVTTDTGGQITILAYVYDADGLNDVSQVEILVQHAPTGVFLYDNGTNGDWVAGDGVWTLYIPVGPGVPNGEYLLQLQARDSSLNFSPVWPNLPCEICE